MRDRPGGVPCEFCGSHNYLCWRKIARNLLMILVSCRPYEMRVKFRTFTGAFQRAAISFRYQVYLGGTCSRLPAAASQVKTRCWTAGRASQLVPVNARIAWKSRAPVPRIVSWRLRRLTELSAAYQIADEIVTTKGFRISLVFAPSVTGGLLRRADLAGYRDAPVYIRHSMYVSPNS